MMLFCAGRGRCMQAGQVVVDAAVCLTHCSPMSLASRITRVPRPHDRDRGREIAEIYAGEAPQVRALLEGAGGSSPYLHGLLIKEHRWLREALAGEPEDACKAVFAEIEGAWQRPVTELGPLLRRAKRQLSLLAALADLGGVWPLDQVTQALTDFADLAVDTGVKALVSAEIDRGKIPGAGEEQKKDAAGMAVLAMGKMGAHELNYSSDIDLICLFDESRFAPEDYAQARAAFIRATRRLCSLLSEPTAEGYVFRTDLRLRPDASVTPVCLSMDAAERYYESVGRTWERAAYIKARASAGDIAAGEAFLQRLSPFVWRRHLDFASIRDAHDMRLRIREHKGLQGALRLEGHDMKLGAGGIREIEFFTQTRQIIAGGRDPSLRVRKTLVGLDRLQAAGWVPADVVSALKEDYRAHREIEHRLQMINDAQTHSLPRDDEGFRRLAALCGREVQELRADISRRLDRVNEIAERFFAPGQKPLDHEIVPAPAFSQGARAITERWPTYPALRSARAVEIFSRLRPTIFARLEKAAQPEEALNRFDAFLAGLPAGVQVFSMLEANPQLLDMIIDIISAAPHLARYLGRNSQVFDAVLAGQFFAPWPGMNWLADDLSARLEEATDYEEQLMVARRWQKEWHFRIGVHHLRGLIGAPEAGSQYAQLAEAVLRALCPVVLREFGGKHGAMPGEGAMILAMGSLGAGRLGAVSDLDLIVIYDAPADALSDGRRPLAARQYYARFTQALVTALSAPMAEGRLYEVDMRLRPSGRQGPVATSLEGFCAYQETEAWTWEHLALTRARPVAGSTALGEKVELFRRALIGARRDTAQTLADVADMRKRLADAKPAEGRWDAKSGPGRMMDIELFAQTAALLASVTARDTAAQLGAAERLNWLDAGAVAQMRETHALLWRLQAAGRLLTGGHIDPAAIGQGGLDFILRETGAADEQALEALLHRETEAAARMISAALGGGHESSAARHD